MTRGCVSITGFESNMVFADIVVWLWVEKNSVCGLYLDLLCCPNTGMTPVLTGFKYGIFSIFKIFNTNFAFVFDCGSIMGFGQFGPGNFGKFGPFRKDTSAPPQDTLPIREGSETVKGPMCNYDGGNMMAIWEKKIRELTWLEKIFARNGMWMRYRGSIEITISPTNFSQIHGIRLFFNIPFHTILFFGCSFFWVRLKNCAVW